MTDLSYPTVLMELESLQEYLQQIMVRIKVDEFGIPAIDKELPRQHQRECSRPTDVIAQLCLWKSNDPHIGDTQGWLIAASVRLMQYYRKYGEIVETDREYT